MKTMSIIGIVVFSLALVCILALMESDLEAAAGWGFIAVLYALPYSIVGLVKSGNKNAKADSSQELVKLHDLKEKGILSEEEFQAKKAKLL